MVDDLRDAFISYGHADADWVRVLAENLHRSGLEIFFDEWDVAPGDVLVHKLDKGILTSRNGVLIVSPEALARPWVEEEYAAMMTRAVAGQQRLIPVLLKDTDLPVFVASRVYVDFRNADGPLYETRVKQLVAALKGEAPARPARDGGLQPPPASRFAATGARMLCLSIDRENVKLSGDGVDASGPPPQPGFDGDGLKWELERTRSHAGPVRESAGGAAGQMAFEAKLLEAGARLAAAFLPPQVVHALEGAVAEAEQLGGSLQLALSLSEPLADLPWETLRLPKSGALALHPRVGLYRRIELEGAAPAVSILPPLRILVAIGSPEAQNQRDELLDMEAETKRILDATDRAQRAGDAFVRILEEGSVAAIRSALIERPYHILHISCHANEGVLILEDARGAEDRVTAERLWKEAIPAERAPPLVVLAGCSTGRDGSGSGAEKLPGLAKMLVDHGVPAVVAMQAPVCDFYATELMGEVYAALSTAKPPKALAALSDARRKLETKRQADRSPSQAPPEWATPTLFTAATPLPLYDSQAPKEDLPRTPEPSFDPGVVVRRVGDMVGRRSEQRQILRTMRDDKHAGVLLHGIGGVGKSTLAAQILHRLAAQDEFLLFSLAGATDPDRVLGEIGNGLFSVCLAHGVDERHPWRQLAGVLNEPKHLWRDRFGYLSQILLAQTPLAFLFDNFEDNLTDGQSPSELAELLSLWLRRPGKSRLLFTSRFPFALPEAAENRLFKFPLGPLSWAETRKLFGRLDGLKELTPEEQRRAYEEVGGHPRALEYFDAILRGGVAQFPQVQERLRKQLAAKGVADPARWCADTGGGIDAALAETVTQAADDVLLDVLLEKLDAQPLAKKLLFAVSVYRVPVDETGLAWLVSEKVELPPDPARQARVEDAENRVREAEIANPLVDIADVLSQAEMEQYARDIAAEARPPITAPEGFSAANRRLTDLSLLTTVRIGEDGEQKFFVHRWTAGALERLAPAEQMQAAHKAAADHWLWRVEKLPQTREKDIEDLLEARHHLHFSGDLARFHEASGEIILQLETWGAWEWEERLLRETLACFDESSREAAALLHHLGILSQRRGDYDAARDWCRKSLAIKERLGDRAGMARSYHELGVVAQDRGDYDAALDWYRKALAISEQLGNRADMAASYHQLGVAALQRGDYDAAFDWYRKSLVIEEQLGNRAGIAASYQQLGGIAQERGDYDAALDWYRKALAIKDQLGDRASIASSYHELGMVAQARGEHGAALDSCRKALAIFEQLGNRVGIAASYLQLGGIAQERGDYDAALDWYRKALAIFEQLGNRAGIASSLGQIGVLLTETGEAAEAAPFTLQSLALRLQLRVPQVRIALHWLSRQRQALGAAGFADVLDQHLDAENKTNLLAMLDDFEKLSQPRHVGDEESELSHMLSEPVAQHRSEALAKPDPRWIALLFATTRCKVEEGFSGERNNGIISFGAASVRIPEKHEITKLERPFKVALFSLTLYEEAHNPERHFTSGPIEILTEGEWMSRIRNFGVSDCLIFVHGFNTEFQEAVLRFAQIVWDLRFDGLPVLFSWPSRGAVQDYIYDRDSAQGACPQLIDVLQKIASQDNIHKIHILAHSMGNFCVLDALANHVGVMKAISLGEIVMAAPDIDRDLYKQRVTVIQPIAAGMTLYASAADRALALSKKIAGNIPRAGDIFDGQPIIVDGIDAIDVTFVGEEMFGIGHGTYAGTRSVINDLKLLLTGKRPPHDRLAEIGPVPDKNKPLFWRYRK